MDVVKKIEAVFDVLTEVLKAQKSSKLAEWISEAISDEKVVAFTIIVRLAKLVASETYHMVRVCEEAGRKTVFSETNLSAAINYLESYIASKQEQNFSWFYLMLKGLIDKNFL
uniref:Uncharacterized protein n=1 Tax=Panagrolaimus davidi TaxID=227884 RepID=A0A914QCZ2_9BILA